MDKKRLRVALKVLEEVKVRFLDTKQFIDDTMEEERQKEKISADEVSFYKPRSKELAQRNILCFAVNMLRDIVLS